MNNLEKEDWMNSKWRPMMGWMYMVVCMADFVIFPILWSIIQALGGGRVETQWSPITLQGAGLFHMAMGAVLGVTAWSRGQEKMAGVNNGGLQQTTGFGNTINTSTASINSNSGFGAPAATTDSNKSSGSSIGSVPATTNGKTIVPIGNEPEL